MVSGIEMGCEMSACKSDSHDAIRLGVDLPRVFSSYDSTKQEDKVSLYGKVEPVHVNADKAGSRPGCSRGF